MTHSPESHHEQEEPERIPIDDPRSPDDPRRGYRVMDSDFTTTHRGPNGEFYQIKNKSDVEASNTLYRERVRSEKLRNAQANGLYRLTTHGAPIRPHASSKEFQDTIVSTDAASESDRLDAGNTGGFISYGKAENGNNEKAAIDERSASIVLSYQARDKALQEGKSIEEAQEIGSQVYIDQEGFKEHFKRGTFEQPEATNIGSVDGAPNTDDEVIEGELLDDEESNQSPDGSNDDEIIGEEVVDDEANDPDGDPTRSESNHDATPTQNEKLSSKERREQTKLWLRTLGRNAKLSLKTLKGVGVADITHFGGHKLSDALQPSLDKAMKIIESIKESPDQLSKRYRAAKENLQSSIDQLKSLWSERLSEARNRKSAKHDEKLRKDAADQEFVDERIAKIFAYLGQKHPDNVFYKLYSPNPED